MFRSFLTMRRICLFALGLLIATPLSAQTKLAYRYRAGDVQRFVMTQATTTEMTQTGQLIPVETKTTQTMYMKISTDEVASNGTAKQRLEFTRIVNAMTLPGPLTMTYDSDAAEVPKGPLADMVIRTLKPLVNAEFKQTVDAQGRILELTVPDTVLESLKANPGAALLGEMGTPEGFKKFQKLASVGLPTDPIKVGSTWERSSDNAFPFGTMSTKTIYKYLGPEKELNLEKVGIEVNLAMKPKEGSAEEVKLGSTKGTGQLLFDNRTGTLHEMKTSQSVDIKVTAARQTVNQKVVTEMTMRREGADGK